MTTTSDQKAIHKFTVRYRKAREAWERSGGSYSEWIQFYEEKADALDQLRESIPQIAGIDQFWTWIGGITYELTEAFIQEQVDKIRSGWPCFDCGVNIKWPAQRCDKCAAAHKNDLEERREIAKRLKKKGRR